MTDTSLFFRHPSDLRNVEAPGPNRLIWDLPGEPEMRA